MDAVNAAESAVKLRDMMEGAMVGRWDEGLTDEEAVYRRYFEQCDPFDCYYDEKVTPTFMATMMIVIGLVGLIFPLVQVGVDVLLDAIGTHLFGIKKPDVHGLEDIVKEE